MKRTIILSLLGLIATASSMAQEAFVEGDFRYVPTSASTVSVDSCCLGEGALAIIPEKVQGYTVTAIAARSFADSKVAAVYMPNTIAAIGEAAFYQCHATFIKLSPNATTIGRQAFYNCPALGHIDIPEELERLESGIFCDSPIYTLGDSQLRRLNYVGASALAGTGLQHFSMTDAVTYLGPSAFYCCTRLQDIHLPDGLTEIPNHLLYNCSAIKQVELPTSISRIGDYALAETGLMSIVLPAGLKEIGQYAFQGSTLNSIDLSQYQGSIGFLAFNDCENLSAVTLPAANPYCYTSEDGKVIYDRERHDLLSVLPSIERLIIPYPATGEYETIQYETWKDPETGEETEYESSRSYIHPLSGTFSQLIELELPHTWKDTFSEPYYRLYTPALKKLTMRMPADIISQIKPLNGMQEPYHNINYPEHDVDGTHVYVFDYVKDVLAQYPTSPSQYSIWEYYLGKQRNAETNEIEYTNLHFIERPTEELYKAEVIPMYNIPFVDFEQSIVWASDWNTQLEEAFPQYYTAEETRSSKIDYKQTFRNYMAEQYLTPEHYKAFAKQGKHVIQCLDGRLVFAEGFDVNNYTNWYLAQTFIPAKDYVSDVTNPMSPLYGTTLGTNTVVTLNQPKATDPTWQLPVSEYSLLFTDNYGRQYAPGESPMPDLGSVSVPTAVYPLHMVPNVNYRISMIMPPRHPLSNDSISYKNRIQTMFTYLGTNSNTGAFVTRSSKVNTDILFDSGKVDTLLLMDSVQVQFDVYNLLTITSQKLTSKYVKEGFTSIIPLIGILCEPLTPLETYPDAVDAIVSKRATVVESYDLQGRRIAVPRRGINILRMSDGTTRKIHL